MLEALGVKVHFAGIRAVDGVDLVLAEDEVLGLIGPNGAGKTTLVNVLTGFQRPASGNTRLDGHDITGAPPHRLARLGVGRTFQDTGLFPGLAVMHNIELGAVATGVKRREARRRAQELLDYLDLGEIRFARASELSHGDAQRVGILRALAMRPRFILLDEPAAGLNDAECEQLMELIRSIRRTVSCGVLVIDHKMHVIMGLSSRVQVLDHGKTIAVGTPEHVVKDTSVIAAYLGSRREPTASSGERDDGRVE